MPHLNRLGRGTGCTGMVGQFSPGGHFCLGPEIQPDRGSVRRTRSGLCAKVEIIPKGRWHALFQPLGAGDLLQGNGWSIFAWGAVFGWEPRSSLSEDWSLACPISTVGPRGPTAGEWLVNFRLAGSFWLGAEIQPDRGSARGTCCRGMVGQFWLGGIFASDPRFSMSEDRLHQVETVYVRVEIMPKVGDLLQGNRWANLAWGAIFGWDPRSSLSEDFAPGQNCVSLASPISTVGLRGLTAGEWLVNFWLGGIFASDPRFSMSEDRSHQVETVWLACLILTVGPRGPAAGQSLGKSRLGGNFWLGPKIQPDRGSVPRTTSELRGGPAAGEWLVNFWLGGIFASDPRFSMSEDRSHQVETVYVRVDIMPKVGDLLQGNRWANLAWGAIFGWDPRSSLSEDFAPGQNCVEGLKSCLWVNNMPYFNHWCRGNACLTSTFGAGEPAAGKWLVNFRLVKIGPLHKVETVWKRFTSCLRVVSMPRLERWGRGICCRAMVGQISPGGQFLVGTRDPA
ncbi:hypothetical protein B0H16DRAFT_1481602 [Mycena metata]|uniref:Uncharacterized protein n=1 Tax=Mycena metata TaxID=1033252 RepID=A0AAD7GX90_9AGAR|nr:hypothetical protein B0H16DRAFT_1481602 [Mycena metata]